MASKVERSKTGAWVNRCEMCDCNGDSEKMCVVAENKFLLCPDCIERMSFSPPTIRKEIQRFLMGNVL